MDSVDMAIVGLGACVFVAFGYAALSSPKVESMFTPRVQAVQNAFANGIRDGKVSRYNPVWQYTDASLSAAYDAGYSGNRYPYVRMLRNAYDAGVRDRRAGRPDADAYTDIWFASAYEAGYMGEEFRA